jgi:hypothetical protein
MNIATASKKRILQVIALFAVLGISASAAGQTFTVSPNSSGGTAVTINGYLGATVAQTFTITNTTSVPTTVFATVVANANSGFTLPGFGSVTVAGNSSNTLTLNFTPLTTATQNATLYLFNGIDSASVMLQGLVQHSYGVTPNSSLGTNVSFHAGVGAHDTEVFTITNNTGADIAVASSLSGAGASAFSLSGTSTTVDSASTGTLRVAFNPTAAGTYNATLRLVNGVDTTLVNLTGSTSLTGDADFTVTPLPALGLPLTLTTAVNVAKTQTFTVTNTGDSAITVNAAITGSGSAGFSINPTSRTILADSSATFTLSFNPTAAGTTNATLTFSANGDSTSVNLIGVATGATNTINLTLDRGFVEFNNVVAGVEECKTVYITNNTNGTVTLSEVTFIGVSGGGNQFSIGNNFTSGTQLAAGASDSIVVCFTPTTQGQTVTANLKLKYRGTDSTKNGVTMIRLEGNTAHRRDSLNLNLADELDFDAMPGETECQTVALTNPSALLGGTAWLTLADSNAGFSITSGDSIVLGPLGTGSVTICYTGDSLNPNSSTNLNIVVLGEGGTFLGQFNVTLNGETELEIDEDLTDSVIAGDCFRVRRGGNFGPIISGGTTSNTITITNQTNSAATITSGTITSNGQATTDFTLDSGMTFPITIAAWGTTTIDVSFNPMDSTRVSYNARLNLDVEGTDCNDLTINLHGVSLPNVAVGPQGRAVDTVGIVSTMGANGQIAVIAGACEAGNQTVAIQNNLSTAVTINDLDFMANSNFTVTGTTTPLPVTLQPGDILGVQVNFECGQTTGIYESDLQVMTAGAIAPVSIPFQTLQQAAASVARAEASGVTITVSPNPTRGIVRIEAKEATSARIEILNVLGQVVATSEGTSFTWNGTIDGSSASAGVYFVRVSGMNSNGLEFVETEQIVVE